MRLLDYAHYDETQPMPTTRLLPELYDDTLKMPAIQHLNLRIDGYDAALLIALAHESGVTPEALVRREARMLAQVARYMCSKEGR